MIVLQTAAQVFQIVGVGQYDHDRVGMTCLLYLLPVEAQKLLSGFDGVAVGHKGLEAVAAAIEAFFKANL